MATGGIPEEDQSSLCGSVKERLHLHSEEEEGVHEVEFGVLENGSSRGYTHCRKNEGHKNMSLVRRVMLDNLPEDWRFPGLFRGIMKTSRSVVKLTVRYVSPNRPDKNYPGCKHRGQWYSAVGSGLADITDKMCNLPYIQCPLPHCKLKRPHLTTPMFKVSTSNHVVWDDIEVENTTVEFFYDQEEDLDKNVVEAHGVKVITSGKSEDHCIIICVSHDLHLFKKVTTPNPYVSLLDACLAPTPSQIPRDPLVVIISHPHGHYKHVAWGEWVGYSKGWRWEDRKVKDMIRDFEEVSPQWRETGSSGDGIYFSPQIIQEWKSAVEEDPEMILSEWRASQGYSRGTEEIYASITYNETMACPGSSGAPVWIFLPGQKDQHWVCAGFCYHFHHRRRVNLNASGWVALFEKHGDIITTALKGRVEH